MGAILGLISKVSLNKIFIDKDKCVSCGKCLKTCPSGCIHSVEKTIDNETCVKCLKCLTVCKKDAVKYGKPVENPVKFSPKRREIILAGAVLLTFGAVIGAIKAGIGSGIRFSKDAVKKIKNIILPPGAVDIDRMANTCLNCNLCIENCTNKILVKADDTCPVVHIDYSKGEKHCKFGCNECSKTCPSGAIRKISKQEKQNTRIAMAGFNETNCTGCGLCAAVCPKGAIEIQDGKAVLDATKCIGCGKCATECRFDAIEIYPIKEQKMI